MRPGPDEALLKSFEAAHRWALMEAWRRHLDGVRPIRDPLQAALPMSDEGLMRGLREVARRYDEVEADLPVESARRLFRDPA